MLDAAEKAAVAALEATSNDPDKQKTTFLFLCELFGLERGQELLRMAVRYHRLRNAKKEAAP